MADTNSGANFIPSNIVDANAFSTIFSDVSNVSPGGTPFWIVAAIIIVILLVIIYFVFLKNKKQKEPMPRVPHPMHDLHHPEPIPPAAPAGSTGSIQQTVNSMIKKTGEKSPSPYTPGNSTTNPPVSQNAAAASFDQPVSKTSFKPAPIPISSSSGKTERVPRRLARFERQEREDTGASPASRKRGKADRQIPDIDVLAEAIAQDVARSDAVEREMQELQKRLAKGQTESHSFPDRFAANSPVAAEPATQSRHGHRFQKQSDAKKPEGSEPSSPSTASVDALSQVEKMDFKDLFENKETKSKKNKDELDEMESELKGLGGDEPSESDGEMEKCPSCKKETEKVLYCPECGNAFCKNCAAAFKRKGNDNYLVCPKCQTEVKDS